MAAGIRPVRVGEFEQLMAFLERCFGHSKGFFLRQYPHIYRPTKECCSWGYVMEKRGHFLSHVGVYPLETTVAGVSMRIAGIGGVATAPEERGKNHMSQMLKHIESVMSDEGYPLSALGGDRRRYNHFGWESAGMTYCLKFTKRSLDGKDTEKLCETSARDAVSSVRRLQDKAECYANRPNLELSLKRQNLRFFVAKNGYAIGNGEPWDPLSIIELVSANGKELEMINSMFDITRCRELHWHISAWEKKALSRVLKHASSWSVSPDWDYRIVDLLRFLRAFLPRLQERAAPLCDDEVSIAMVEPDRTQTVLLIIRDGTLQLVPAHRAKKHVELDRLSTVRLLCGGLPVGQPVPPVFERLFPLPVHVPELDHV